MPLVKPRLTLDDFKSQMLQISPKQLQLHHLQDWVSQLNLDNDWLRQHIRFCDQQYCRKLLCRTARFDMLLLCWRPGQSSSIHDHADSLNVTRVYLGELTSRIFAPAWVVPTPTGSISTLASRWNDPARLQSPYQTTLRLQQETRLCQGGLTSVDRYQIHQLANTASENLVTLHVYARPLQNLQVYCPTSGRSETVAVQYE